MRGHYRQTPARMTVRKDHQQAAWWHSRARYIRPHQPAKISDHAAHATFLRRGRTASYAQMASSQKLARSWRPAWPNECRVDAYSDSAADRLWQMCCEEGIFEVEGRSGEGFLGVVEAPCKDGRDVEASAVPSAF